MRQVEPQMQKREAMVRSLESNDISEIVGAFRQIGWNKPASQYERYLIEQKAGLRDVFTAFVEGQFVGYLTISWLSHYKPFQAAHIPEITDFNVLPQFRRMGIGTQLMDRAEQEIGKVSPVAGIGVGMTPDYGAAQKLYVLRGYIPDGLGLHWRDHHIRYHEDIVVDDDLALYFTKVLR